MYTLLPLVSTFRMWMWQKSRNLILNEKNSVLIMHILIKHTWIGCALANVGMCVCVCLWILIILGGENKNNKQLWVRFHMIDDECNVTGNLCNMILYNESYLDDIFRIFLVLRFSCFFFCFPSLLYFSLLPEHDFINYFGGYLNWTNKWIEKLGLCADFMRSRILFRIFHSHTMQSSQPNAICTNSAWIGDLLKWKKKTKWNEDIHFWKQMAHGPLWMVYGPLWLGYPIRHESRQLIHSWIFVRDFRTGTIELSLWPTSTISPFLT